MKIKRSVILVAAVLLLSAVLLSACSDGRNADTNSPSASPAASAELSAVPAETSAPAASESGGADENRTSGSAGGLTEFTTTDLNGNTVTQDIFADYSLTMVNIWATFCSPCINELPDLGQLKSEYQDKGVNIVGIVADVQNSDGSIPEEGVALAKEIVDKTGANYTHLLPSESLNNLIINNVDAVPTTVFVDDKGNYVGEQFVGSKDKQGWAEIIDGLLQK